MAQFDSPKLEWSKFDYDFSSESFEEPNRHEFPDEEVKRYLDITKYKRRSRFTLTNDNRGWPPLLYSSKDAKKLLWGRMFPSVVSRWYSHTWHLSLYQVEKYTSERQVIRSVRILCSYFCVKAINIVASGQMTAFSASQAFLRMTKAFINTWILFLRTRENEFQGSSH